MSKKMKTCWKVNILRFLIVIAAVFAGSAVISGSINPAEFGDVVRQGAVFYVGFIYILWVLLFDWVMVSNL